MKICTKPKTPAEFTTDVADLLNLSATHIYFDTSFLMWLTMIGGEARLQFIEWARTLGERTHVPLWSMHEYYRHHTGGTLRSDLANRADGLMGAARDFQKEARKYADQSLMIGQPEAAYQDSINNIIESIKDISDTAKNWDYNTCAVEVIKWMNLRALQEQTVFNCMDTLAANGAARYTQDVPPGFLDRRKEDTLTRGSNRYGDLLFWQEVVQHARTISATSVIIVTRDRKGDWFAGAGEPIVEPDWQRVKAKWLPVPHPHPTLAFELKIKAGAELVLLDELYLGALLWKFGRPKFERLASVAIAVAPGHFERVAPPPRPVKLRAQKRLDQAAIGMNEANTLLKEAVGVPAERVTALLGQLDQLDAPLVDEFIEQLGAGTLEPLSKAEIANLTRCLHDRAKLRLTPAVAAAEKLLNLLDGLPADTAAASYLGFLCSAYLVEERPLDRPESPFLEDIFAWQHDPAMQVVLKVFGQKMRRLQSAALYLPGGKDQKLALCFEHDAEQQQDPVALTQIYVEKSALLVDGEARPSAQLRTLVGVAAPTIREIARALSRYYGLPFDQLVIQGGDLDDRRSVPPLIGLREFSRFDLGNATVEMAQDAENEDTDEEESESDDDFDAGVEDE